MPEVRLVPYISLHTKAYVNGIIFKFKVVEKIFWKHPDLFIGLIYTVNTRKPIWHGRNSFDTSFDANERCVWNTGQC